MDQQIHHEYLAESQEHNESYGNQEVGLEEVGLEEEAELEDFVDVEERVQEVMTQVVSGERDVGIEERQLDTDEKTTTATFSQATCGCKKGIGNSPSTSDPYEADDGPVLAVSEGKHCNTTNC